MIVEIFRKDRKQWTKQEVEAVEMFYKCNKFFSKSYDDHYFEDFVNMTYYTKVSPDSPLLLIENKRPSAVVLLNGNIVVSKKQIDGRGKRKKHKYTNQFKLVGEFIGYNETIELHSEAQIKAMHGEKAQIVFVPSFMYNAFISKQEEETVETTFELLHKVFKHVERRPLLEVAKSGCSIQTIKINSYVYRQGQKPEFVYIILDGSMKMEKPGFSNKPYDITIVSATSIVGDKDICYPERQSSLRCCSATGRLLKIPKNPFLKFAKLCLPDFKIQIKEKWGTPKRSPSKQSNIEKRSLKLPSIFRFHSARRSKEQEEHEYKLIKNSHILLQASSPSKNHRIRTRSSISEYPRDPMAEKIKLYKKLRPVESKLDLTHRIF